MLTFLPKKNHFSEADFVLPVSAQIKAWRKANRRMKWHIGEDEFAAVNPAPELTEQDRSDGFTGSLLCYGFGDDGNGFADAVQSGREAWRYAQKRRFRKTWQCQYIDFDKDDYFRLRPDAPRRPKGFYHAKFRPGDRFLHHTVASFRKQLENETGCGPEGIQMVAISHYPHVADLMHQRKIALMAFADYDVAPYGFNDFFDVIS